MQRVIILSALLFGMAGFAAAGRAKPVEIAVMEFASKGGITPQQMEALEDMLTTEIRKLGDFRVIAKSDLDMALQLEQRKQLVGCRDDSCLAEVAGALGVRWLITGNVSLFGKTYLINMKLLDVPRVRIASSVSKKIKGEQDQLLDALPEMTREMFESGGLLDLARGPELTGRAPGRPFSTWGHVTFWSGAGFLAFGGVSAYLAGAAGDDYDKYGHYDDLNASRNWSGLMWTGFGLGAALVTTGIILWALEPEGEPSTSLSAGPTPDGTGMVFSLGGRW